MPRPIVLSLDQWYLAGEKVSRLPGFDHIEWVLPERYDAGMYPALLRCHRTLEFSVMGVERGWGTGEEEKGLPISVSDKAGPGNGREPRTETGLILYFFCRRSHYVYWKMIRSHTQTTYHPALAMKQLQQQHNKNLPTKWTELQANENIRFKPPFLHPHPHPTHNQKKREKKKGRRNHVPLMHLLSSSPKHTHNFRPSFFCFVFVLSVYFGVKQDGTDGDTVT